MSFLQWSIILFLNHYIWSRLLINTHFMNVTIYHVLKWRRGKMGLTRVEGASLLGKWWVR